jgi:cytochrome P450
MLAHLLQALSLIDKVREETATAFLEDGTVDLDYLHDSVPQLDAMWNEMLRLSAFAASVRLITADTVVGGKLLRKGNRLIIPYRQLHMDESVYSESVDLALRSTVLVYNRPDACMMHVGRKYLSS